MISGSKYPNDMYFNFEKGSTAHPYPENKCDGPVNELQMSTGQPNNC